MCMASVRPSALLLPRFTILSLRSSHNKAAAGSCCLLFLHLTTHDLRHIVKVNHSGRSCSASAAEAAACHELWQQHASSSSSSSGSDSGLQAQCQHLLSKECMPAPPSNEQLTVLLSCSDVRIAAVEIGVCRSTRCLQSLDVQPDSKQQRRTVHITKQAQE